MLLLELSLPWIYQRTLGKLRGGCCVTEDAVPYI